MINDLSVGAVGAAVIAGLVSLLGLLITKEQKVSEFRQAWINDLRGCLIEYLANLNAISDVIRSKEQGAERLISLYKGLNTASHGITFRINPVEDSAKRLLETMASFETMASENTQITPENIKRIEDRYISSAQDVLKHEWNRVRDGEPFYVWIRRLTIALTGLMLALLVLLVILRSVESKMAAPRPSLGDGTPAVVCGKTEVSQIITDASNGFPATKRAVPSTVVPNRRPRYDSADTSAPYICK